MGLLAKMRIQLCFVWIGVASTVAHAQYARPTIVLDYTYDTNNFFGAVGSPQRLALQAAATNLTSRLADNLTAITPNGINTWTAIFDHPGTGVEQQVTNLSLVQNEIRVFAGGSNLSGSTLGVGGPGGYSAGGFSSFLNNLATRGQTGASGSTPTDFAPWGGAITFDTSGTTWNFSLAGPVSGQADFLSVAEHELGHLLGIGTAESWSNKITGTTTRTFTGANVRAANGGTNPTVTADGGHFASGTTSTNSLGAAQEAAMTPSILIGSRKEFTAIDYAALADIGWQVTPIPEPALGLGLPALAILAFRLASRSSFRTIPF
jgi:hypothetical protein